MLDVAEPELPGCGGARAATVEFVALDVVNQMTALTKSGNVRGFGAFAAAGIFALADVANGVEMSYGQHHNRACNWVWLIILRKAFFAAIIGALESDVCGKLFPIWRITRIIHHFIY